MLVDAPAAGLVAEVVHDAGDGAEGAVGLGARDVDPGVAEADDVGAAVAGGVGQEPRMPVDAPAAGLVAEVVHDAGDGAEGAVGLGARDVDAGVAEADDVGAAVAGGVGQEPRMPVDAPAAGLVAEVFDDELRRAEGAVGLGARDVDAGVAEADDVGAAVAGGVGQEPRMPVDAPAAGLVAEVVRRRVAVSRNARRAARARPRRRACRSRRCRRGRRRSCRPGSADAGRPASRPRRSRSCAPRAAETIRSARACNRRRRRCWPSSGTARRRRRRSSRSCRWRGRSAPRRPRSCNRWRRTRRGSRRCARSRARTPGRCCPGPSRRCCSP